MIDHPNTHPAPAPDSPLAADAAFDARGELTQDRSELDLFIPKELDDFGLASAPFRILLHLSRRAQTFGVAWPGVRTIARVCRLAPKTIIAGLKVLVEHRLLSRTERPGKTALYRIEPKSRWIPLRPSGERPPPAQAVAAPAQAPLLPALPLEPSLPAARTRLARRSENPEAEAVYLAYPKKVGRPAALRAIRKAVNQHGFAFVKERTLAYARVVSGGDLTFIPNPSTFFNQERFADDPSTWRKPSARPATQAEIIDPAKFTGGVTTL